MVVRWVSWGAAVCLLVFAAGALGAQQAPAPSISTDRFGRPNWVDRPEAAFPEAFYLARVGSGRSRAQAEAAAFAALTGYFGQTVKSQLNTVESYKEEARGGAMNVASFQSLDNAVQISSNMEQLIGAEMGAVWQDGQDRAFYAVAFMDKAKCAALYDALMSANIAQIEKNTALKGPERGSLEAVARFRRAGIIADANAVFATVLAMLGGPNRRGELKSGDDYRIEARSIASAIPVFVSVKGDEAGRVKAALTSALAACGLRSGGEGARYRLEARFTLSPAEFPGMDNKFARFDVEAYLNDATAGLTLTSFTLNGREGHATQIEANRKATRAAEEAIKTRFAADFEAFLFDKPREEDEAR